MRYSVGKKEGGSRLDAYLVRASGKSRNAVKALLDAGRVRVNGRRVGIAKWGVQEGDRVEIGATTPGHRGRERTAARQFIEVLYEDRDVILVNKAAGVPVTLAGKQSPFTVVDQVRSYLRRRHPGSRGTFAKPVHRLDTETSGVMALAKSKEGEKVIAQFKAHTVRRRYVAVVEGSIAQENGKIALPLIKGDFPFGKKVAVARDGKESVTEFRVEERYSNATLVELTPQTGRTHQIRVHLAAIGHPLIGDKLYGRAKATAVESGEIVFPRHALHAAYLAFKHPVTGEWIEAKSPIPKDMVVLIDQLRGE